MQSQETFQSFNSKSKQGISAEAIQSWLVTRIAAMQEIDPTSIDPRQPFTYYGLGSVQAVSLTGELEDRITSYNVCYTKLLRLKSFVWIWS